MTRTRTYIDANVLIAAFQGTQAISERAMAILDDPARDLVVSDPLWLETVPKARFHRNMEEVDFYEAVFDDAVARVPWSEALTTAAADFAVRYGIAAMDAIHTAAAVMSGVDEFTTAEKSTKPLFRVSEIRMSSLRD